MFYLIIFWNPDELYAQTGIRQDSSVIALDTDDFSESEVKIKHYLNDMADCFKKSMKAAHRALLDDDNRWV